MKIVHISLCLTALACLLSCREQAPAPGEKSAAEPVMKYGVTVQSGPMDSILLKDYKPASSLVVPRTPVGKARFPVIDVHTHSDMNGVKTADDVDAWVRVMDETGVETSVVFTGAVGEEFDRQAELFLRRHPKRFQVYCDLLTEGIDAPDYPQRAVKELERCYQKGARGVGELSDKGAGLQGGQLPRDKRLHVDDPRLDPFWEKCAELKLPVNLHIADHPSCWQPLGPNQERTPDFQHFNLYGMDVPSYEELLASRDRLLQKHPRTTIITCHLSNQGNDLASLAKALDRYPNLYADISARDYEIGRQPRNASKFLASYKDRIMFGTDMGRDNEMYLGWWRLLETPDEYLPGRIWWTYYGLELPPEILKSLYRDNALRVLNWK
ncbi:MAG: amidohydrolase [Bryobacteraceae bacterium]|nr:amidohydrolase [Bryobacteraceae bacterium]